MIGITIIVVSIAVMLYVDSKCTMQKEIVKLKDVVFELNQEVDAKNSKMQVLVDENNELAYSLKVNKEALAVHEKFNEKYNINMMDIALHNKSILVIDSDMKKASLDGIIPIDVRSLNNKDYIVINENVFKHTSPNVEISSTLIDDLAKRVVCMP